MPQSAIASGSVDFVLSPREMAKRLNNLSKKDFQKQRRALLNNESEIENTRDLKEIFRLLYQETGVDFCEYKLPTIKRRIHRRTLLIKKPLKDYVKFLDGNTDEINILYQDLLINVTGFFRDSDAHHFLKKTLFPAII